MLVTNSIKNDMASKHTQFVNGLALAAVGDIGSAEMCQVRVVLGDSILLL